jgi:hypothetical protein
MTESSIREWTLQPSAKSFGCTRFERTASEPDSTLTMVEGVQVDSAGTVLICDEEHDVIVAPTDVVLAAIFRQAGIVDDLRAVLQGGVSTGAARGRIIAAFGEALS